MASGVVQLGHCYRSRGSTGTNGEQRPYVTECAAHLVARLRAHGHIVTPMLADDRDLPSADFFIALHADGSTNSQARGASVGYRNALSGHFGAAWKRWYARRGFPGGFRSDNYTPGLARYYGTGWAANAGIRCAIITEAGFLTNPYDRDWVFANIALCAQAHVDVVGEIFGHPSTPSPPPSQEEPVTNEEMQEIARRTAKLIADQGLAPRTHEAIADNVASKILGGRSYPQDAKVIREGIRALASNAGLETAHDPPERVES